MTLIDAPIVYVGPTLERAQVTRLLPNAIVRAPIGRGDLYRDRMLRGTVFLILDGVFMQEPALSPREILDVIADGALVIGAASMGALRAAECWPAGMQGVGAIYRLFRRGLLGSDDEVAVLFDADRPAQYASVALINVRYATWRARRAGQLTHAQAGAIVTAAQQLFYAERSWRAILQRAGLGARARELCALLSLHDLKQQDAARALRRLARLQHDARLFARPRASARGFTPLDETRERDVDALSDGSAAELKRPLLTFLGTSGRYLRYRTGLAELANTTQENVAALLEERGVFDEDELQRWLARWAISSSELVRTLRGLARPPAPLALAHGSAWDEAIWAGLALRGDLDCELLQLRALRDALTFAAAQALEASAHDLDQAERALCQTHGTASWSELCARETASVVALERHRREQALARAVKRVWFARGA